MSSCMTSTSRPRHHQALRQSRNTAIASFDRGGDPALDLPPVAIYKLRFEERSEELHMIHSSDSAVLKKLSGPRFATGRD